jgi:dolichol-phosphate mannosyltransferase
LSSLIDLSVIIPARHEAINLGYLLPEIHSLLTGLGIIYEVIVCDELADRETIKIINVNDASLRIPDMPGYGAALQTGFSHSKGEYIITMDADLSHPAAFLDNLWMARDIADVIIASRYVDGGSAIMPLGRLLLSRILNLFFSWGLGLRVRDMSSGYRMYRSTFVKSRRFSSQSFSILQEVLIFAILDGYTVHEIPFTYQPRVHGSSHARIFRFGLNYLTTFFLLRKYRTQLRILSKR